MAPGVTARRSVALAEPVSLAEPLAVAEPLDDAERLAVAELERDRDIDPRVRHPTATATNAVIATATPAPSVFPGMAKLAPDLALVRRKLTPDSKGRIKLSLRCKQLTAGTRPATCDGKLTLTYRSGGKQRKAAAKRFSFGAAQVGLVTLKLNKKARRAARQRKLKGRSWPRSARGKARKKVKVKRLR